MKSMPIDILLASLVYSFARPFMPSMLEVSVPDIPIYDWLGFASLFFAILILVTIVARAARTVRPTERGLVERFGEYRRFVNPGLTFLFPIIDRLVKVNVTEQMSHVEPQDVITKDKVVMSVDAVVFFKVKSDEGSVKASVYNVNVFQQQIEMLARTTLRNIIGKMDMAEANVGRGIINEELTRELAAQSVQWGVEIMRAELKDLSPPRDIQESMNTVIKANNAKLAAADMANAKENEADGFRRAAIKNAEGQKQGAILEAEGRKISLEKVAEGQANAIRMVNEAYTKYFKDSAITAKQLETIADSLRNNTKIIVPEGNTLSLILNEAQSLGNQIILPLPATKSKPAQEGMTQ